MKENISKNQLREFGLLIGFVFPIFIGWLLPVLTGHEFRAWTLWVGAPSLILGLISPRLLYYPYKFWISLGHALGWVNSKIVLGLVSLCVQNLNNIGKKIIVNTNNLLYMFNF